MSLDLNMGYNHFQLAPNNLRLCTCLLPWGKDEYFCLPIGSISSTRNVLINNQWYIPRFKTHPSITGQRALDNQKRTEQSHSWTRECTSPPYGGRNESQCRKIAVWLLRMLIPWILGHRKWDHKCKDYWEFLITTDVCWCNTHILLRHWQSSQQKTPNKNRLKPSKRPSRRWNNSLEKILSLSIQTYRKSLWSTRTPQRHNLVL